jgi:hypothetical protein
MLELLDPEDGPVNLDVIAVLELVGTDDGSALLLSDAEKASCAARRSYPKPKVCQTLPFGYRGELPPLRGFKHRVSQEARRRDQRRPPCVSAREQWDGHIP